VFLIGAACWSHGQQLIQQTFRYFKEQESLQLGQNELSVIPAIVAELFLASGTDCQADVVYQVQRFLKEVRGIGSACYDDKESQMAMRALLSAKLENFRPILALNTVVLADLISALGLYIGQGDPIPWQTMVTTPTL